MILAILHSYAYMKAYTSFKDSSRSTFPKEAYAFFHRGVRPFQKRVRPFSEARTPFFTGAYAFFYKGVRPLGRTRLSKKAYALLEKGVRPSWGARGARARAARAPLISRRVEGSVDT